MSDAPERIWAEPWNEGGRVNGRWTSEPRFPDLPTQYVRADLYTEQAAEILTLRNVGVNQAAEIERLKAELAEARQRIGIPVRRWDHTDHPDYAQEQDDEQ